MLHYAATEPKCQMCLPALISRGYFSTTLKFILVRLQCFSQTLGVSIHPSCSKCICDMIVPEHRHITVCACQSGIDMLIAA